MATPATRVRVALAFAALLASAAGAACSGGIFGRRADPDALWKLVSTCINQPNASAPAAACSCPAFERSCCGDPSTPTATVVWAETRDFVAIRDLNMCGCSVGFVSGLAMPRARVTGIEDPNRPEGIWPFAWDVARTHIQGELDIGLVINPRDARTQNQMHVHLLRLQPGIRAQLDAAAPDKESPELGGAWVTHVADLDTVFGAALAHAGEVGIADTGVLVARARDGGFVVVFTSHRSPQAFTVNRCPS